MSVVSDEMLKTYCQGVEPLIYGAFDTAKT